jgi:hypothetical protein
LNSMRLFEVVIVGGISSTFTDYILAGAWLHKRFAYSEAWRSPVKTWAIVLTTPLPFLSSAAFAVLLGHLEIHSIRLAIKMALEIWAIGPLPLTLTNAVYMKLRGFFVIASAFAWLVRLLIMALLAVVLLR